MILQDFVDRFSQEFEEAGQGSINGDTIFRDLEEWSSMQALLIIAMIDEEYEVTLTADDIKQSKTVEEIYTIVKNRMN